MKTFERLVDWRNKELADLPQNAYTKVSLTRLDWATFALVAALCLWKNLTDSLGILNAWLIFLGGCHGFHYWNVRTAVNSPSTTPQGVQIPPDDELPLPAAPVAVTQTTTSTSIKTGVSQ